MLVRQALRTFVASVRRTTVGIRSKSFALKRINHLMSMASCLADTRGSFCRPCSGACWTSRPLILRPFVNLTSYKLICAILSKHEYCRSVSMEASRRTYCVRIAAAAAKQSLAAEMQLSVNTLRIEVGSLENVRYVSCQSDSQVSNFGIALQVLKPACAA